MSEKVQLLFSFCAINFLQEEIYFAEIINVIVSRIKGSGQRGIKEMQKLP